MWTRGELKAKAKKAFKANYWQSVLTALILTALTTAAVEVTKKAEVSEGTTIGETLNQAARSLGISVSTLSAIILAGISVFSLIGLLIKLFALNPIKCGARAFFVKNETEKKPSVGRVLDVFKGNYFNTVVVLLLKDLFIALWSLLLVIPGIIKAMEYRMVDYILAEDSSVSWSEAAERSKAMMYGHKWNAFVLDLSFIGWEILSALTYGILGVFYVKPYVYQTDAELYLTLKNQL